MPGVHPTRPLVERQPRRIRLPPHSVGTEVQYVEAESLVVVGANGSGKTRFGLDIESNCEQPRQVYRIAAQRLLEVPDFVNPTDADAAMRGLWYGYEHEAAGPEHRQGSRYGGRPATFTLNDYQRLLQALLSDEYQQSTKFMEAVRSGESQSPPDTLIERLKRVWHSILPHRTLRHRAGRFEVLSADVQPYHSKEMSDGERVLFYLIGQTLCAPSDGLVIVDEPELHLHRAVQSTLWDALEAERAMSRSLLNA